MVSHNFAIPFRYCVDRLCMHSVDHTPLSAGGIDFQKVFGKFPSGDFPDGLFPDGIFRDGQWHFPDGQFPGRQFPGEQFSERAIPQTNISPTDTSRTDISPNGTFPRMNISPNHVFHFRSKKVIDINEANLR